MVNDATASSTGRTSILIVGADGMMGRQLVTVFEDSGKSVYASTRRKAQVNDRKFFLDLAEDSTDYAFPFSKIGSAILCAASTSMENCRVAPAATRRVNVENTVVLAKRLVDEGVFTVFLSSNTVFDGKVPFAKATDPTNPQTEYGHQKADAEEKLLSLGESVAVVRFSKIIPPDMPLLTSWVNDLRAGKPIHPFADRVMAPVSLTFAVELLDRVLAFQLTGITQASANTDISYELAARHIASRMSADIKLIESVSSTQLGTAAAPIHTTMGVSRLASLGIEAPAPTVALDQFTLSQALVKAMKIK